VSRAEARGVKFIGRRCPSLRANEVLESVLLGSTLENPCFDDLRINNTCRNNPQESTILSRREAKRDSPVSASEEDCHSGHLDRSDEAMASTTRLPRVGLCLKGMLFWEPAKVCEELLSSVHDASPSRTHVDTRYPR